MAWFTRYGEAMIFFTRHFIDDCFYPFYSMMIEMMVWIIGPKEEEVVVLFSVAEGALTSKNQVAVQSGLMTNTKGMGLLKMKKRPWRTVKKKRTDARRKR